MTLKDLYNIIAELCNDIQDVRTFIENDVLFLNGLRNAEYGVVAVTQNQHTMTSDWKNFSLNIFFIDRLLEDRSNEVDVQSHAVEVLNFLIKKLSERTEIYFDFNTRLTTFTERFVDLCAGAFVSLDIRIAESDCAII